ncbi:dna mismatch repair protein mlh1, partial [Cystoisospora suis]
MCDCLCMYLVIRKCIEAVYKDILPRGLKPWIYLSITLPPWLLDVNVHPTKQQVQLLYEDYIAGSLSGHFQKLLEEQAGSQTLDVRPISSISHLSQKTIQGQSFPFSASSGPCQDSSDVAQTQSPAESAAGVSSTRSSEEQDTLQESSSSAFHSPCVFETIHLSGGGEQGPAIIRTFSEDESTDAVSEVSSQIGTDGCTALQRAGKPSSSAPSFPASRSKSACGSGSSHSTSGTGTESRTALKPTRVRTDYRQTTLSSFLMTSHRSDPPPLSHRHHTQRPVVEEEQKSQTVSSSVGEMDTAPSVSSSSSSSTSSSPTVHSCRSGLINTGTQGRHDPVPSSQGNTDSTRLVSPSSTSCSTPAGLPSDSSASLLASSSSTTASRGSFLSFKSKTVEKIMNTRPPLEQIVIRRFSTDAPYLTSVQSLLSLVVSNSHDASHDPTSSYLSSADISSLPNSHFSCAHMAGNATSYPFSSSTSHNQVRQETRGSLLLSGSQKQLHGRSATQGTSAWMRQGVFVGCLNGSYALLQYDRYLLLVQLRKVLKECLYQSVLRRLGRLPPVGFSKPLDLKRLLMTGIKKCLLSSRRRYQRWLKSVSHLSTSEDQASDDLEKNKKKATFALEKRRGSRQSLECLNKEIILDACLDCLVKHRHLLCDYFSIAIVQMASVRRGQESTEQKRSPRAHSKRLRGEEEKEVRTVGTDRKDRGEKE